jgi:lipoprotein NlpD
MAGKVSIISIILVMFCLLLHACAGQHYGVRNAGGVYHRVKKGETLYRIAQAYKVNLQDLAEVNDIDNPEIIEAGSVLFIPNGMQVVDDVLTSIKAAESRADIPKKPAPVAEKLPPGEDALSKKEKSKPLPETGTKTAVSGRVKDITPPKSVETTEKGQAGEDALSPKKEIALPQTPKIISHGNTKINEKPTAPSLPRGSEGGFSSAPTDRRLVKEGTIPVEEQKNFNLDKKRFVWPVEGNIISRFGIQKNGMFFNGIRIKAKEGSPVVVADAGTVIFSASLKDYGETVIVKHEDNFATVYANLGQRLVKCDDQVKKGDKIALLGSAMPKGASAVHFEIRQNNKARNPLFFLP